MPSNNQLILIFSLNDCKFAIEIECLVEVTENVRISATVENKDCLGKVDFRGESLYLVDIKKILKMGNSIEDRYNIIIARTGGTLLAVPVDSVDSVEEMFDSSIPFPDLMLTKKNVLTSIYKWNKEFVYKINLEKLLNKLISTLAHSVEN